MTYEDLLQEMLKWSPAERAKEIVVFDYSHGEVGAFRENFAVQYEGTPEIHFTVEGVVELPKEVVIVEVKKPPEFDAKEIKKFFKKVRIKK